jgi:hypothetical protein
MLMNARTDRGKKIRTYYLKTELIAGVMTKCINNMYEVVIANLHKERDELNKTIEELKFALQNINVDSSDEVVDRIMLLVAGNNPIQSKSGEVSEKNINYKQFCELFDQRSKYFSMKAKRNMQLKTSLKVDWRTNLLSKIIKIT